MRISDWSSDVCSSDLVGAAGEQRTESLALILRDGMLTDIMLFVGPVVRPVIEDVPVPRGRDLERSGNVKRKVSTIVHIAYCSPPIIARCRPGPNGVRYPSSEEHTVGKDDVHKS